MGGDSRVETDIHGWRPAGLPAGRHVLRVRLGTADGLGWFVLVARGRRDGPVLLVTAGVHGDEYEGMEGLRRFFATLDPNELRGTVVAIPVVHEAAYEARQRVSPLDGMDLARAFPGRADGSPTQRIAWALRHELLPQCDFYCDLHSGGLHYRIAPLAGYQLGPAQWNRRQREACVAFGMPRIWGTAPLPGRTLSAAREAAVPAIYVEFEGGGLCRPQDVQHCCEGLRRLCAWLGMLEVEYPTQHDGLCVEDDRPDSGHLQSQGLAECDGFFRPRLGLWDRVREGDFVGEIVDPPGDVLQRLEAACTGWIVFLRTTPCVKQGECCFAVMPDHATQA